MRVLITILVVLLFVLQYKLWFGDGGFIDVWQLQRELESQKAENESLRERNVSLEAEVRDLKQGLQAIEERARRELGMIGEGETFYQTVDE